jgi:transaldolase
MGHRPGEAHRAGQDVRSTCISVASFFVSRVDTAVDADLEKIGGDARAGAAGQGGAGQRPTRVGGLPGVPRQRSLAALEAAGAFPQRPLWASTSTKDPALPDDMYVVELAGPGCVNTMPEPTLRAVADHGHLQGDTLDGQAAASQQFFDDLTAASVSIWMGVPQSRGGRGRGQVQARVGWNFWAQSTRRWRGQEVSS